MQTKNVFVYHLDNELQKLFSLPRYNYANLYAVFKLATRIAFLICKDKILIPASNYFESDLSFRILNELRDLNRFGAISLVSSSHNIDELLRKKGFQHGDCFSLSNYHYLDFLDDKQTIELPGTLIKRERSASLDIKKGWLDSVCDTEIVRPLARLSKETVTASLFEDALFEVPRKLGSRAFISDYILPLLPIDHEKVNDAEMILNAFITRKYIASFLKEYNAVCLKDIPIIDSNSILPESTDNSFQYVSYSEIVRKLQRLKFKENNAFSFISNCSVYELIEFKHSPEWEYVSETLSSNEIETKTESGHKKMDDYSDVKIGIITALPKECAAMKMMLHNVTECFFDDRGAGHRFFVGKLKSANEKAHKVVLAQCGMGNNSAAIRATNMLNHFHSIDSIIMTGIAGGIPSYQSDDKQVRLGDIVISNGIIQYDFVKEMPEKTETRSSQAKPSARLLESVDILKTYEYEHVYPWQQYIDEYSTNPFFNKPSSDTDILFDLEDRQCKHPFDITRTEYPKVYIGAIASANTLLKNPKRRDALKEMYGVLAVEMEASGIADATWNHQVGYLVVRGVCDYCDTHKNDLWQEYAALVAAAYTRSLIENIPCF